MTLENKPRDPRDPRIGRLLSAAAVAASLLFLHGCGGGDDGVTPAPPPPPPAPAPTTTLSGVVLSGGALQSAKVCLDLNDNRVCDAAEPSGTSSASGAYTLAALQSDASSHALVAEAGTTAVDAATGAVTGAFTLVAPAGHPAVISPFTTLLQSEVDSGRSPNQAQAEEHMLSFLVGIAGDVGGLAVDSNYLPSADDTTAALATKRLRMQGLAQLLTEGFIKTRADRALTGKAMVSAYGLAAVGSLQQVASQLSVLTVTGTTTQVSTGPLTVDQRNTLFGGVQSSLVPSAASVAAAAAAAAKTAAAPIEGAWTKTTGTGATAVKELYLFAGDGTFVHQVIETGAPATSTVFDNGFGYRLGRYTLTGTTLTTTLLTASNASGPGGTTPATLSGVTLAGNTLTADGGVTLTRVTSSTNPLVGGWVRPDGSSEPEFLVMFDDGSYTHSTFYYQNDPQTGSATFFETAKSAGLRKGEYTVDATNTKLVNFGATTVIFNGTLAIPSNPGVAVLQPDNSLSLTGLRLVKLGTTDGAKAVTGFTEAAVSRLWSGRYFSRTVSVAGVNRTQYVYVRGANDVLTFLQAPTGSDVTVACGSTAATTQGAVIDFTSVTAADGKLKQFVVGTGTAASAGYAQRRLNVGQPGTGNFVSYLPITRPTNATARCAVPI